MNPFRRREKQPAPADGLFSPRQLKKLIIPLIIEQALAISVGMADTVMVSSLGDAVMSGVSLVDNINTLVLIVLGDFSPQGNFRYCGIFTAPTNL